MLIFIDEKVGFAYSSFESPGGSGAEQERLTGANKALAAGQSGGPLDDSLVGGLSERKGLHRGRVSIAVILG